MSSHPQGTVSGRPCRGGHRVNLRGSEPRGFGLTCAPPKGEKLDGAADDVPGHHPRAVRYWADQGCVVLQPYDAEVGAGTFHPATTLRALGPDACARPTCSRPAGPTDGRYGENPNRLQHYYQYQVILNAESRQRARPVLRPLRAIGIEPAEHDVRLVETTGSRRRWGVGSGLGGLAQRHGGHAVHLLPEVGGFECRPVPAEITYGLERLAMYIQGVDSVYDITWSVGPDGLRFSYGDVFLRNEQQYSAYNFEIADVAMLLELFPYLRAGVQADAGGGLRASRVRLRAQVLARLQPARCPRCDQRHRAPGLHPTSSRDRQGCWRPPISI